MQRTEMKRTGGFFKDMLEGLKSSVGLSQSVKHENEIEETLQREHFQVLKTVRHGFPFQPTAVAFDPIQRILAIGTRTGSLKILGKPGVECHVHHLVDLAVIQIVFLVNEGALISVCSDDTLHLWNLRQKRPEILHSLKFQRERITYCHLPFQSKWLYIGTERGNVYTLNVESFVLSGYVIHWNKAIKISQKTHPGCVVHLSENPVDANKLLIAFETGTVVLWDLRNRAVEMRLENTEHVKSVSWHHDGKQLMCSHINGSLSTWNIKMPMKPITVVHPHLQPAGNKGKPELCKPIYKVEWKTVRRSDAYIIFTGGHPYEKTGKTSRLTVLQGNATTVLEMDSCIVDFVTLCESPWQNDFQEPYAVVVVLNNELVVVDLTTEGFPSFPNLYPMDLHESPVTFCTYLTDCSIDFIPALFSVGSKRKKHSGFSKKEWPISGGEWGTGSDNYSELIITGHADGSLKFWDASSVSLQFLYKLKSSKIFEQPKTENTDYQEDEPFAIEQIFLCSESRILCIAGASSHVVMFTFNQQETDCQVTVLEIPIVYEVDDDPECSLQPVSEQGTYSSAFEESAKQEPTAEYYVPLKVKSSSHKRHAGFQAELVCLTPWVDGEIPGHITALSVNSSYGLMAYGNECGLVVVDLIQKTCLLNMGTPDLYGSADPYRRVARSPKRNNTVAATDIRSLEHDSCCSPSPDQTTPTSLSDQSCLAGLFEKIDSSFSWSRSSSVSSLENVSAEVVQWLCFADSFSNKSDPTTSPSLWVGTSLGSILVILLTFPSDCDHRLTHPVIVSPSGTIYRLKESIVSLAFLDSNGALIPYPSGFWKDVDCNTKDSCDQATTIVDNISKNTNLLTPLPSEVCGNQFVVMVSEKQARVMSVPSQSCVSKANITDTSFVVCAKAVTLKSVGNVCLACFIANGNIVVYSLPSLRLLYEVHYLSVVDMRTIKTFCFSTDGHGLYLCSASEIQKFSISSSFSEILQDMLSTVFVPKDMPEAPRRGFFRGLFGGGPSTLDREGLFGERSGKASGSVAQHIPGNSSLEHVKAQTGSLAGELARARLVSILQRVPCCM
ncbi:syntaxin-binding protein 5-like isoform X1 [Tachypleus tridentatus]|uniref:syntaxin-binding protein 5-like isoform X1 n=1 Tax=Tachypleus tridentatus TaxID=6853 RepID=UPI003FD66B48